MVGPVPRYYIETYQKWVLNLDYIAKKDTIWLMLTLDSLKEIPS
jgi:hypothetical protein